MIYDLFAVVVVPFPFTDKEYSKKRPALVLSSVVHQEQTQHLTLLMITSAKNSAWPSDHLISELKETGLSAPSIIRQKIFTLDARLIIRQAGRLSPIDQSAVVKQLKLHLTCAI